MNYICCTIFVLGSFSLEASAFAQTPEELIEFQEAPVKQTAPFHGFYFSLGPGYGHISIKNTLDDTWVG